MQVPLTLDTIGELDSGAARVIIDAAIRAAIVDLDDRGEDQKPRKVVITLDLKALDNGMITASVDAQVKVPARRTASTLGNVRTRDAMPQMMFQTLAPDDPSQRTIDEVEERQT